MNVSVLPVLQLSGFDSLCPLRFSLACLWLVIRLIRCLHLLVRLQLVIQLVQVQLLLVHLQILMRPTNLHQLLKLPLKRGSCCSQYSDQLHIEATISRVSKKDSTFCYLCRLI